MNFSYALSNESMDFCPLNSDENILLMCGEVYFDSNALSDGDGSEKNHYIETVQ